MAVAKSVTVQLDGVDFTFETGKLANLADGSAVIKYGNSVLLATAGMNDNPRPGMDFFPLMCDYDPKYYATGKIKGSRFMKREGRPPESAILTARMIDRPLRPMFPKGMMNDVQIIVTLLQADGTHSDAAAAITGASMALQLSGIPFEAPVSAVRVGMDEKGEFFLNPTYEQVDNGDLDLIIAGTEEAVMMVEAGARLISNDKMIAAFEFAHERIKKLCAAQSELASQFEITPKTPIIREVNTTAEELVANALTESDWNTIGGVGKKALKKTMAALQEQLLEKCAGAIENEEVTKGDLLSFFDKGLKKYIRNQVMTTKKRLDGRGLTDIRTLDSEVSILPRTHGSGLFTRGDTQGLSVLTVGPVGDAQLLDDPDRPEFNKYYFHHYNFPPYSVGEVKPLRGTNRREIGHGTLAERALQYVMPTKENDNFPYTIRVVSEILACNGSSSMASVCGSTLALMDGGVPIKSPISGIAMGLVMNEETGEYDILSDIQAQEDFCGDMDLKVCGDENGLTALQMDIKLKGLSMDLLKEALTQAQDGRAVILDTMKKAIPEVRKDMSEFAPRVTSFHINPDYIRVVIGKGGETIQGLCAEHDVKIDLEDDGLVMVASSNGENAAAAVAAIKSLAYEPEIGDIFKNVPVKSVMDFGAFVEFVPGKEALVHVSEIAQRRIDTVSEVLKEGDKVNVKLTGVDKMGRIKLSMKDTEQDREF